MAAKLAREGLASEMPRVAALRDRLENGLRSSIEFIHINGENVARLPTTSNLMVDYAEGEGLVISLDLKGGRIDRLGLLVGLSRTLARPYGYRQEPG
jgi:cysteine desulfurase